MFPKFEIINSRINNTMRDSLFSFSGGKKVLIREKVKILSR